MAHHLDFRLSIDLAFDSNLSLIEWGIELDETDELTPWIPANPSLLGDYLKWPNLKYTSPLTVEVKVREGFTSFLIRFYVLPTHFFSLLGLSCLILGTIK